MKVEHFSIREQKLSNIKQICSEIHERFWKIAKETGNKVIIGMDAHSPEHLVSPKEVSYAEKLCEGMERFEPVW